MVYPKAVKRVKGTIVHYSVVYLFMTKKILMGQRIWVNCDTYWWVNCDTYWSYFQCQNL